MTMLVDFLPASYRERCARRRANRERVLMAIPVVVALLGTDLLLRARVRGVRQMAEQARTHAARGEHLGDVARDLGQRAATLQSTLEAWCKPLAAARMTALLDSLVAERPPGVLFHEVVCRHDPWSNESVPTIHVGASCTESAELTDYLAVLRASPLLPPLQCQRKDKLQQGAGFEFHLDSESTRGQR